MRNRFYIVALVCVQLFAAPAHAATASITYVKNHFWALFGVEQFKNGKKEPPSYETWDIQCKDAASGPSCVLERDSMFNGVAGCTFARRHWSTDEGNLAVKRLNIDAGILDFSFGEPDSSTNAFLTFSKKDQYDVLPLKDFKASGTWRNILKKEEIVTWEYRIPEFNTEIKPNCQFVLQGYKEKPPK